MFVVPGLEGTSVPLTPPIVATVGVLLVHVPPGVMSVSVTFVPWQIGVVGPTMLAGCEFTVTCVVARQPVGSV